ncbi:hypothetical protein CYMTET_45364 [Cymbomonas tetramitiformis]|uniref:RING-type domain-containing protein n=1 Tax=Cymbomonas tetramitiformis TaxID=36881 RepID=A0AAE0BYC5_9CHLO|nr:hypothetical protein CYMTET_45364 [Cymbomonas tetramitiformis]
MMKHLFRDLLVAAPKLLVGGFTDMLGIANRPIQLAGHFGFIPPEYAAVFDEGSLVVAFLGALSFGLLAASVLACCSFREEALRPLLYVFAVVYLVDAAAQLPQLLFPYWAPTFAYPLPLTGVSTCFQLRTAVFFIYQDLKLKLNFDFLRIIECRYPIACAAVVLRYSSAHLLKDGAGAWVLYALAVVLFLALVLPYKLAVMLLDGFGWVLRNILMPLATTVYQLVVKIWPLVKAWAISVLQHRLLIGFYNRVLVPVWCCLSPWALALTAAAVATSTACDIPNVLGGPPSLAKALPAMVPVFTTLASAASFCILGLHAVERVSAFTDPLRSPSLTSALLGLSYVLSLPVTITREALPRLRQILRPLMRRVSKLLTNLLRFAVKAPVVSAPLVIVINVAVLRLFVHMERESVPDFGKLFSYTAARLGQHVPGMPLAGAGGDSVIAFILILGVQTGAFHMVHRCLTGLQALRSVSTGEALSVVELEELAQTMTDPRRCGCCGFGPVDHTGCSDLFAHHGERRGRSSRHISNACPRCGWFVRSIRQWPPWDVALHTPAGQAVHRVRVWAEVTVVVRAASKALVIPLGVLRLGATLGFPDSLSAMLAFSYLIPWLYSTHSAFQAIFYSPVYQSHTRPLREAHANAGRATAGGADSDSCGAPQAHAVAPGVVAFSTALTNILAATPDRVFLGAGDICCVCLEEFPASAASIASSLSGVEAAQELRALKPSVIGLRCGHPLHVQCAEAAIRGANQRHVRCPLCREPVTTTGAVAARAFT